MLKTYVLILVMMGPNQGGVATAEFEDYLACERAGEKFLGMAHNEYLTYDYRCVEKGRE